MNLRETVCQDVNMTDLNDGCVKWHHFTSTAVNLMSRYLSSAPKYQLFQTLSYSYLHMSFILTKFSLNNAQHFHCTFLITSFLLCFH